MQKWEYKIVSHFFDPKRMDWFWSDGATEDCMDLWDKLNELGEEGWEYIERRRMENNLETYLFKRPKE